LVLHPQGSDALKGMGTAGATGSLVPQYGDESIFLFPECYPDYVYDFCWAVQMIDLNCTESCIYY